MTTQNKIKDAKFVAAMSIAAILVCSMLAPINFASAAPGKPSTHPFTTHQNLPKGANLLVEVNYKVTNDEDSGFVGYWALDNYVKHVTIYSDPSDGTYWAIATYDGTFDTFAGAPSPQNGITESTDARGNFHGGYTFHFTGIYDPQIATKGNLGTYDFGGTESDVLANGGNITPFGILDQYFPAGQTELSFDWGWTYTYTNQFWANLATGSSGDIVA